MRWCVFLSSYELWTYSNCFFENSVEQVIMCSNIQSSSDPSMFWQQTLHSSGPLRGHDKHKLWKQLRKHQWSQNGPRENNIVQISSSQTPWELCVEGAQTPHKLMRFSHITRNQSVTRPTEVETPKGNHVYIKRMTRTEILLFIITGSTEFWGKTF